MICDSNPWNIQSRMSMIKSKISPLLTIGIISGTLDSIILVIKSASLQATRYIQKWCFSMQRRWTSNWLEIGQCNTGFQSSSSISAKPQFFPFPLSLHADQWPLPTSIHFQNCTPSSLTCYFMRSNPHSRKEQDRYDTMITLGFREKLTQRWKRKL